MNKHFAQKFINPNYPNTLKRAVGGLLSGLLLTSLLLAITPQAASAAVREKVKEPLIMHKFSNSWYIYCKEPQACADEYAAQINAQHAANGRRIRIKYINKTPRYENTVQGVPFSFNFDTQVTSWPVEGSPVEVNVYSGQAWTTTSARCPIKSNGSNWMDRVIEGWPHHKKECVLRIPDEPKICDEKSGGLGNPIFPIGQLKLQREEDYVSQDGLLDFTRTYRSDIGRFSSILDQRLVLPGSNHESNSHCEVLDYTGFPGSDPVSQYCFKDATNSPDQPVQWVDSTGSFTLFDTTVDPDNPLPNPNQSTRLKKVTESGGTSSWLLSRNRHIERYNADGRLLGKHYSDGRFVTYDYSDANTPVSIAPRAGMMIGAQDAWGRSINFNYQADGSLLSFEDPAGQQTSYTYDTDANQVSEVEHADGSTRQYFWNEPTLAPYPPVSALTGVQYENGERSSYKYDYSGKVLSTERAGGVDKWVLTPGYLNVRVTDPLGTQRTIGTTKIHDTVYSTTRSQPAGVGCGASSSSRSFDANGNVISKTDFNGNVTSYTFDLDRNLETQRVEASGTPLAKTISTEWHPDWGLKVSEAQPEMITSWVYNGQTDPQTGQLASCAPSSAEVIDGLPIAVVCKRIEQPTTDENGSTGFNATPTGSPRIWNYTYNQHGKVLTADGPRTDVADIWQYEYWPDNATCPGAGEGTGMDKGCRGELSRVTNPLGHQTDYLKYNAHGQVLEQRTPNNVLISSTYNLKQQLVTRDAGGVVTSYDYNALGLVSRVAPAGGQAITYTYDNAGRLTQITQEATGEYMVYTLDAMGNRTAEQIYDASGSILLSKSEKVYDALGRLAELVGAYNQTTKFEYDANGNRTQETDPNLNPTNYAFDALDFLKQTTDADNGVVDTSYDSQGNPSAVEDQRDLETTYAYNGFGELISQTSPDTGTTSYTVDEAGNRLSKTDARGITTTYTYDALNRLTAIHYPDSSQDISNQYDQGLNGIGRLTQTSDAQSSTDYTYNPNGQLLSQTRATNNGIVTSFDYHYDSNGRLITLTYPSGRKVHTSYNTVGQEDGLTLENPDGTSQSLVSNLQYLPFGPLHTLDYGNSLQLSNGYNQDYRLISQSIPGVFESFYNYDPAGNILDWTNTNNNQSFTYDVLDRLATASGNYGNLGFGYDATGNRLSLTEDSNVDSYNYATDSHHLLEILGINSDNRSYDAVGNTISSQGATFEYDASSRLMRYFNGAITAEYAYDDKNLRLRKDVNGVLTYFRYSPQGQLLGEYDGNGNPIREYIYLAGVPIAQFSGSAIAYLHTDHLGSVIKATDEYQNVVWSAERKPFGERSLVVSQIEMPLGFPGQYLDSETGLFYNWNRYYDSSTGRYITSDPIGLDGGINTFGYVEQNPIINYDPEGENTVAIGGGIGGSIAGPPGAIIGGIIGGLAGIGLSDWLFKRPPADFCEDDDDCDKARKQCHPICVEGCIGNGLGSDAPGCYRKCMRNCLPPECADNY